MKAIIDNGTTYKVTSERGAYTYTEDNRGKVKCFLTSSIEVVEISEMPKAKKFVQSWSKGTSKYDTTPSVQDRYKIALEAETGRTGLTLDQLKDISR